MPDHFELRNFFFEFMLAGYASGRTPETVIRFPGDYGTKRHSYGNLAGWYGIDEWRTTKFHDGSAGTTSLYHKGHLVWEMHYFGHYPEACLSFLKSALLACYQSSIWEGGRGPERFEDDVWRYQNMVNYDRDLTRFSGREFILNRATLQEAGEHRYFGGSLLL